MSYCDENKTYNGFIYCIKNDINNKIYVGQTTRTIKCRFTEHKNDSKSTDDCPLLYNSMRSIGQSHFYIEELECIVCKSRLELQDKLNEREIFYIKHLNTLRPNGYNLSIGGDSFYKQARKIDVYDYNGTLIKQYESAMDVADAYGITPNCVYNCCNGNVAMSRDRIYRYHGDPFNKYPIIDKSNKELVDVYDTIGNYYGTCMSLHHAAIAYNSNVASVHGVCNGSHSHANYFVFRYCGDPFDLYYVKPLVVGKYDRANTLVAVYISPRECMKRENMSTSMMSGHLSGRIANSRNGFHYRYITTIEECSNLISNNTKLIKEVI